MAAQDIHGRVSTSLLERISKEDQKDAHLLLTILRKLAQLLEFTDLSKDISFCVYDILDDLQPRLKHATARLPAITQVNRQIREETRAMVLRKTTFQFYVSWKRSRDLVGNLHTLEKIVRSWFKKIIRDDMNELRQIRLYTPGNLEICFGPDEVGTGGACL